MTGEGFSWPALADLPARPKRFVWHWTAGAHRADHHELLRYHVLVEHLEGDPGTPEDDVVRIRAGVPLARNMTSVSGPAAHHDPDHGYAAHVAHLNSYSGGIALCGMRGSVDYRPEGGVSPGPSPVTLEQVRALLALSAQAATIYELEVSERTFLGHYEVGQVYGVELTPGRWNVSWLPGLGLARDECGPFLREQLQRWLNSEPIDSRLYAPPPGDTSHDQVKAEEG